MQNNQKNAKAIGRVGRLLRLLKPSRVSAGISQALAALKTRTNWRVVSIVAGVLVACILAAFGMRRINPRLFQAAVSKLRGLPVKTGKADRVKADANAGIAILRRLYTRISTKRTAPKPKVSRARVVAGKIASTAAQKISDKYAEFRKSQRNRFAKESPYQKWLNAIQGKTRV